MEARIDAGYYILSNLLQLGTEEELQLTMTGM